MSKKCALMFDFATHYKQMNHAAKLWSEYDINLVLSGRNKEQVNDSLFGAITEINKGKYTSLYLLLYVFFISFRYDKIIVLTAPEYNLGRFKYSIYEFLWFVISIVHRSKVELYIKNTSAYEESRLLYNSMKFVNRIWFESDFQKYKFKEKVKLNLMVLSKLSTAYLYYSDSDSDSDKLSDVNIDTSIFEENKIKIGLIGQFDISRRDYTILLELLDCNDVDDFIFIQIGGFKKTEESDNIRKKYNKIKFIKDFFTSDELDYCLQNCDCLLSMNSETLGYDDGKGTGAFGDAISVRKPLILPLFMVNYKEFSDFSYFYKDSSDLDSIIRNIESFNEKDINHVFEKFSVGNIQKSRLG